MKHALGWLYPDAWKVTPTLHDHAGTDARGNPLPSTTRELTECLIAPGNGSDPADQSAVVEGIATLYSQEPLGLANRDIITIPEGQYLAGRWLVDGRPGQWPLGEAVKLVRG